MDVKNKTAALKKLRTSIEADSSPARKRLEMLFDEGTFVEIGAFVKQRPSEFGKTEAAAEGVVTGYGSVAGTLVFAFAQDPSVLKGSISEMNAKKICNIAEMAVKANAPIVSMIDTCGIRLLEGMDALSGYGKILKKFNKVAGAVFHVSIVFGTSAGAMSFIPATADYTIMMKDAE
ncbi:MAG: carboxyl transferase domain-containing protein, partial [Eubacteriales bacterium]